MAAMYPCGFPKSRPDSFLPCAKSLRALHPTDPSHLVHSGPLLETCQPLTSITGLWVPPLWDKRHRAREESRSQYPVVALLDPGLTLWVTGSSAPASSSPSKEVRWMVPHSFLSVCGCLSMHVRVNQQTCECVREGMELLNMRAALAVQPSLQRAPPGA